MPFPASRKSPPSAGMSSSIRSTSIRIAFARTTCRLSAVVAAVRDSNVNVGGNVLDANGAWLIVRGVGLIASVDDVKKIVVGASNGVPVYVEQVADVQIGNAFRVASLVKGTREAVGGVVVARTGVNTKQVIDAVKARIAQIQSGLSGGRDDRALLRPLGSDRAGRGHAASRAPRRDRARRPWRTSSS